MHKSPKILELEFTILHLYDNYALSQPKEGASIRKAQVAEIIKHCSDFYADRQFVYFSSRVNNFSVDPLVYHKLECLKNLVGFGVISRKISSLNMAMFESSFSKVPFAIFPDLENARKWIKMILLH